MPYPNEHACRLREPGEFREDTFRRITREAENGKKYDVIMGKLKGESTMTEQAYRYPKDSWSVNEARAHCKKHNGKRFEPAKDTKEAYLKSLFDRPLAIASATLSELTSLFSVENLDFCAKEDSIVCNINDYTAFVNISGVITHKLSFLQGLLGGGTSVTQLEKVLTELSNNDSVKRIVLVIDSPGGEVDGVENLSNFIYSLREKKEVIALVEPLAASAAYWIASAASSIYLTSRTAMVGSIGVVAIHRDYSEMEKMQGIKTTEIYAGKYKRALSQHAPLTQDGKAILQDQVERVYSVFVDAIARNRGVTVEKVLKYADGKLYIGDDALVSGLADGYITLREITGGLEDGEKVKTEEITEKYIEDKYPQIVSAFKSRFFEEGVRYERKRIEDIRALALEGFENLVEKAIKEGISASDFAVMQLKEQKERGITLSQIKKETQYIPASPLAGTGNEEESLYENEMAVRIAAGSVRGSNNG